jgi:hypothetical protein
MTIYPTHHCFDDALDYIDVLVKQDDSVLKSSDYYVVHGMCRMPDGRPYVHAWVEHGDEAIGCGLVEGQKVYYVSSRSDFYKHFGTTEMNKYTIIEAARHNIRTGNYGPWEQHYKDSIRRQQDPTSKLPGGSERLLLKDIER